MEVTIRQEAGYDLALYGMSLSFKDRAIKPEDWWLSLWNYNKKPSGNLFSLIEERRERVSKTATANAGRGKGHDKFLRQIMLWIDIEAPRYWWSEFDTYKVGTVAQSESTMHTLRKRDITLDDFESCPSVDYIAQINMERRSSNNIRDIKGMLPESYLQRRLVTLNYAVLHAVINQRKNHRLPEWRQFIKDIYSQAEHVELLPEYPYEDK